MIALGIEVHGRGQRSWEYNQSHIVGGTDSDMALWLGQLVISRGTEKSPAFKIQYWRKPSMTPAYFRLDTFDELRRYLRHCHLSDTTPERVIEQLQTSPQVSLNTIESEEKFG
jgi:hypothetical protein